MKIKLKHFSTLIFDCDGVILNSNKVKSDAFFNVTSCFSESAAKDLVSYHKLNGGVSRYEKFNYFNDKIIPRYLPNEKLNISELLKNYSKEVIRNLINCEIALGLKAFKKMYTDKKWIMVSGSDEKELNFVLKKKESATTLREGYMEALIVKIKFSKGKY